MKIIYKDGDFLAGPELYKAHGCNAQGAFGSGCAGHITKLYPEARQVYIDHHKEHGLKLGEVIYARTYDECIICHCITQEFYGYNGKRYVDYDAVRMAMKELNEAIGYVLALTTSPQNEIALPKIGAGLAGGDWDTIAQIIEEELTDAQPVVYTL